jgi:hypothetical protein
MPTTGPNPPIETSDAPIDNTLQAPAAPAPAQPPVQLQPAQPAQPPATPSPAAPTRSMFQSIVHGLIGGALSVGTHGLQAVAGPQRPDSYTTDESGKQTPVYNNPDRSRDRIARIAQAALQGLAAGSQVPQQKSGMASAFAGIGAGAVGEMREAQGQDLLKRQQSKEQFETEQRALTDKYIRAQHNITTHALWAKGLEDANEHDPERLKTEAIRASAEDWISRNPSTSMTTQVLSENEARAMQAADKNNPASTTHAFFPYGMKEVKDASGNTVYEKDGVTPRKEGQVFVIGGGSKDGKMPLPQSFVDDLKKYGAMAGIGRVDDVKAGDEWNLDRFLNAGARMNPIKGQEIDGWREKKLGENAVKVGKDWMQENTFTHERRPYGSTPQEVEKNNAVIEKDLGEAAKFRGEANKANSEATQQKQLNPTGAEGLTGEAYLQTLPQGQRDVIKAIAEGRETRTPRQLQDKNGNPTPLAVALHRAYPDFDDKKAAAYGGLVKDFTTGPTSRTLTSYGTAINHARALYDNTGPNSYIPGTDEYKRYNQDVTYVATEVAKALNPTGVATESAIKEQEDALRSIFNRKAAIENAAHILNGKMSEIKQRWLNGQVRPSYQPPMPGLSKEALDNAEYLLSGGKSQTQNQTEQQKLQPQQSQAHQIGDIVVQNGQNFRVTAVDATGKVTAAEAQ